MEAGASGRVANAVRPNDEYFLTLELMHACMHAEAVTRTSQMLDFLSPGTLEPGWPRGGQY